MTKQNKRALYISLGFIALFIIWTLAIQLIDVKAIGPQETTVGFSTLNNFFHKLTGVHMSLYSLTDWLSIIPLAIIVIFAFNGFIQLIKRRSICRVDYNILVLGTFYIAVMAIFTLFEVIVINYRPILINGQLEASYPSSTTMLVMCVMPTAIMQANSRIKSHILRRILSITMIIFTMFMVVGRLVSGVHWVTDILGGAFISTGLVMLYHFFISTKK